MDKTEILNVVTYLEPLACLVTLGIMLLRKQLQKFGYLAAFLVVRTISIALLLPTRNMAGNLLTPKAAYQIYFYVYWFSYFVEGLLVFGIIYSLYKLSMAPLPGLQRLGYLMFRWAGGIALALAVVTAFGPHVSGTHFIMRFVTQLQQTLCVLTLCMLLFVCLASRPMGLSYRSKIFGVCLGLGVQAAADLAGSAWLSHVDMQSMLSTVNGVSICITLAIWMAYFAFPEPKRRMIILPTTSPFLRWNQISAALGDEPGFVAIGDVTQDMFAPAEVEIMQRASVKMTALAN